MRVATLVFVGATLLALTPAVGSAQERRIHVNVGGGPTFLGGDMGNQFSTGWGPAVGVTFDANNRGWDSSSSTPTAGSTSATISPLARPASRPTTQTHQLDFNLVANLTSPDSTVRAYIVAGPGAYNREVEITEYVGNGVICDPYYYVCGTYPVEAVLGSRGGWDFGFNFGGGVGLAIGEDAEFYIESRYHYVAGPEIEPTAAQLPTTARGGSATGHYIPLTFGFRF